MDASPLSTLSLELRMKIYGYVVESDEPVHVLPRGLVSKKQWRFSRCPETVFRQSSSCRCNSKGARIDSLLRTCQQIRDEAIQVMFTSNVILFDATSAGTFYEFVKTFRTMFHYLQSMVITFRDSAFMLIQAFINSYKAFCSHAVRLRHLKVYSMAYPTLNERSEAYELDRYRLLSPLHLDTAEVRIVPLVHLRSTTKHPFVDLQDRAERILLSEKDQTSEVKSFEEVCAEKECEQVRKHQIHASETDNV